MNRSAKGQRAKVRTKAWLEKQGYAVAYLERMLPVFKPGARTFFIKQDQFGADLLAVKSDHGSFVQVKAFGKGDDRRRVLTIRDAAREFLKYPCPPSMTQVILVWNFGARLPVVWHISADNQRAVALTDGLHSNAGSTVIELTPKETDGKTEGISNDERGEAHGNRAQGRADRTPKRRRTSLDERGSITRRPSRRLRHASAETPRTED